MNRVYCLYRVSTDQQVDENNEIQMQKIACRDYIKNQNWCLLKEISEIGVSGFKTEVAARESLQGILDDARNGLFDILLVYMFDRIGRRAKETCLIISILQHFGIRICSVKEGELNFSDGGDLLQYIKFWSAESESRHTQIRVDTRLKQLVSDGEFRGGAVPFGYKLRSDIDEDKRTYLVRSAKEEPIVKLIFNSFSAGKSVDEIRRELEINGHLPRKAKKWSRSSIYAILKNVVYTGRMKYGEVCSPIVERLQIVSQEQYEQVQALLKSRTHNESHTAKVESRFKILCAVCKIELKIKTVRKTTFNREGKRIEYQKEYYYCPCSTHPKSSRKHFPMEETDAKICCEIKELKTKALSKRGYTIRRLQSARYSLRDEQKRLQETLTNKQAKKNDLVVVTLMSDNDSQMENFHALHEETIDLEAKTSTLSATIETIKALIELLKNEEEVNGESAFCNLLVDSISVGHTGKPELTYNTVGKLFVEVVGKKADN